MPFTRIIPALIACASCFAEAIPETRTTSLSGKELLLPFGFSKPRAILIVGFSEKSAAATRAWREGLAGTCGPQSPVACYEVPLLAGVPRLFRGMVVHSINKEIPPELKDSFLLVFEREKEWKLVAGYGPPDDAYVLLVDSQGTVQWKAHGPLTAELSRQLREKLSSSAR